MAKLLGVAVGIVLLATWGQPASAQLRGTASVRVPMVRAMCSTGPCAAAYNFRVGAAHFKRLRQPKALSRREVGLLRVDGVSTAGPPLPLNLDGVVSARVNYALTDPDGDCAAVGSDTTEVIATSSLNCLQKGVTTTSCRGRIILANGVLDDPNCTDVQVFLSNIAVAVFEKDGVGDDTKLIARNGALVTGKTPDCNSGGAGCP